MRSSHGDSLLHAIIIAISEKVGDNRCWWDCEFLQIVILVITKSVWNFHTTLKMELYFHHINIFLGLSKLNQHRDILTPIFITLVFTIVSDVNSQKCCEQKDKLTNYDICYGIFIVIKKVILPFETIWIKVVGPYSMWNKYGKKIIYLPYLWNLKMWNT